MRFIVDHNVGKLVRWLRMMGYDSVFFNSGEDSVMVKQAMAEGRIVLTRDSAIIERRVAKEGRLKVVLFRSEDPEEQMRKLMGTFDLVGGMRPFTLCLECNRALEHRTREEVAERVPPYVYKTQTQYMECPSCHRIYWRGTHWAAMTKKLEELAEAGGREH